MIHGRWTGSKLRPCDARSCDTLDHAIQTNDWDRG